MNVALIHDHLAQDGGAEKVLRIFADLFPEAPIYTLLSEKKNVDKYFNDRKIETSIIQRLPGGVKHYKWYMPFMPIAVEFFDLRRFDLVLSDASAFSKGVITSTNTLHICYCYTPTRYIWDYTHQYINELDYNKFTKKIVSLILNYIRIWDKVAADRVDKYIAISKIVQKRIAKYYRRDSVVIYPPVEVDKFKISEQLSDFYLIGARLSPYKRIDIAIKAFKKLNLKLKIYGEGGDRKRLEKIAEGHDNIEFLGRITEEEKIDLYSRCIAFLNPQDDDFGLTAVEAMASGRPVIAYRAGGALETVKEGVTGEFFDQQTPGAIVEVIQNFNKNKYNPKEIRQHTMRFSTDRFQKEIRDYVEEEYRKHKLNN